MIVRMTARILAFDPSDRLLLFKCRDTERPGPGYFWVTPGGGVEPDETHEAAALRELREETGIVAASPIGPCVLEGEAPGRHPVYGDRVIFYHDRTFSLRLNADETASLDPSLVVESGYIDHRWWPLEDLEATTDPVWPDGLAEVVRRLGSA